MPGRNAVNCARSHGVFAFRPLTALHLAAASSGLRLRTLVKNSSQVCSFSVTCHFSVQVFSVCCGSTAGCRPMLACQQAALRSCPMTLIPAALAAASLPLLLAGSATYQI